MSFWESRRNNTCTICSGIFGAALIVSAVLIGVSLKKLESTEYGVEYDVNTRTLDSAAKSGGLHPGPPGFKFVKFPSTYVTVDLPPSSSEDDDSTSETCVSQDGLRIKFQVTFQYQMPAEWLRPAIVKFRSFGNWAVIVSSAGNSAVQHACSLFTISNFQNKRGIIQSKMEELLREKLEGMTGDGASGVYARAISLQLRNVELPEEYRTAVQEKQSAAEDITLARNQRTQETTKARTQLLSAKEEARKINNTAVNNALVLTTQAGLRAQEISYTFDTEAQILSNVKAQLNLTTQGLLAYIANRLIESEKTSVKLQATEPASLSVRDEL